MKFRLLKNKDFALLMSGKLVSFLASDLILTKATFIQDFKLRDYYIMLFYLLGQVAIISALTLTSVL